MTSSSVGDPDLAVADLAGGRGVDDGVDHAGRGVVVDDDLERTLGTKSIWYSVPR